MMKKKTMIACVHAQNAPYVSIQNDLFSSFNTLTFSSGPFVRFLSFIIRPVRNDRNDRNLRFREKT